MNQFKGIIHGVWIALAAVCLCACVTETSTPAGWQLQYSKNTTLHATGDTFWFTFPTSDGVHYVVKSSGADTESTESRSLTRERQGGTLAASTISATFKIDKGSFVAAGGGTPQVRLYFQRKGDNMSAIGDMEFYRWWSNPESIKLGTAGTFTLSVPLTPAKWSSVYGKFGSENTKMFNAARDDMAVAGFTFGGNYFGHGAWLKSGTAKFTLVSFKIE